MKIEVGKYYRTRDGRKVGPMVQWTIDANHPFEVTNEDGTELGRSLWSESGRSDECSDLDLTSEWAEDDDLNAICDERQDGPFIKFYGTLKTSDKSWPHNGEWSNWFMSGVDGTIKNSLMRGEECEVETQKLAGCKQVAYRFRIKPKPVRETVTMYTGKPVSDCNWGWTADNSSCGRTHRITFTTTDGKPDLDSIKMEALG